MSLGFSWLHFPLYFGLTYKQAVYNSMETKIPSGVLGLKNECYRSPGRAHQLWNSRSLEIHWSCMLRLYVCPLVNVVSRGVDATVKPDPRVCIRDLGSKVSFFRSTHTSRDCEGENEYHRGCSQVFIAGTQLWGLWVVLSVQSQSLVIHIIPHLKLLSPKQYLITLTIHIPQETLDLGLLHVTV